MPGQALGRDVWASLAVAASGALWGIYWIPLRYFGENGLAGGWGQAALMGAGLPGVLILLRFNWSNLKSAGWPFVFLAIPNALTFLLYANAYLFTSIFNTIFLFYLSPVWSVFIARFLLGERTTPVRMVCVAAGIAGLVVTLGEGGGWPIPRNVGDWMALVSGIMWAFVAAYIQAMQRVSPGTQMIGFYVAGFFLAVPIAWITSGPPPELSVFVDLSPRLLALTCIAALPIQLALMWGLRHISSVRATMLLMTEVLAGVASAAWLSGDPFGWRQIVGGSLILAAGVVDTLSHRGSGPAKQPG
jgi:drug/metabolite transporter (DMT)-like permease